MVPQPGLGRVERGHQPHQADGALNPVLPPTHAVASSQSLTYPLCASLSSRAMCLLQSIFENTECLWTDREKVKVKQVSLLA